MISEASLTLAGVRPRLKRLTLVGVFEVGAELDANLAYLHWQDAALLKRQKGAVDGLRVRFNDLFAARLLADMAGNEYSPRLDSDPWEFFSTIALEKTMIGLLLAMIVAVAAFNIVATLVMTVNSKRPDIAVLRVRAWPGAGVSDLYRSRCHDRCHWRLGRARFRPVVCLQRARYFGFH